MQKTFFVSMSNVHVLMPGICLVRNAGLQDLHLLPAYLQQAGAQPPPPPGRPLHSHRLPRRLGLQE